MTNQSTLFPDPATELRKDQESKPDMVREQRTFSVYPQQGPSEFPIIQYSSLKKPLGRAVVMSVACNVMIGGWIRG